MPDPHFVPALEKAAKRYVLERQASRDMPLEAMEIALFMAGCGLPKALLRLETHETRKARTRTIESRIDDRALFTALQELNPEMRAMIDRRVTAALATMKRRARSADARYDINRHAALARLSAAIKAATLGREQALNGTASAPLYKAQQKSARSGIERFGIARVERADRHHDQ